MVGSGFAYLNLITDAYSRKIVGFCLDTTLSAKGTIKALKNAIRDHPTHQGLIHHSDRGVQYCSKEYIAVLSANGIRVSMTERGDPLENAIAERINGILKNELLEEEYSSIRKALNAVAQAISIYNHLRPHSSIGNHTPFNVHSESGKVNYKKLWKNYYRPLEVD